MMYRSLAFACCLIVWLLEATVCAQTNAEVDRYVAADTAMVINLNVSQLMKRIDWNNELAAKFRSSLESEQPVNFDSLQRMVITFSSNLETRAPWALPLGLTFQFSDPVDKQALLKANSKRGRWKYVRDDEFEPEVFVTDIDFRDYRSAAVIAFPADNIVFNGRRGMIREMIAGRDDDSTFGARLFEQIDKSADVHLILDGDGMHDLARKIRATGFDVAAMFKDDLPIPGFEDPYQHIDRFEVLIDFESMLPIQIKLQTRETKKAVMMEQLINGFQVTGPGLIDHQLNSIPDDPRTDVYREFFEFAKTALKEVQVTRENNTVDISLPAIENVDRLPEWMVKFFSPREVEVSGQKLPSSYYLKKKD